MQAVLTVYYNDIQGGVGLKVKIVKSLLWDLEDTRTMPKDKANIEDSGRAATTTAACAAEVASPSGVAEAAPLPVERSLQLPLLLLNQRGPAGKAGGLGGKKTKGRCKLN